jgi:hypothetical protein
MKILRILVSFTNHQFVVVIRRSGERRKHDGGETGANLAEQIAEIVAKDIRADRNGKGDEYDQNGVFCGGGAVFI